MMTEYKNNKTPNIYFLNLLRLIFKNYVFITNYNNITLKQYQSLNATECSIFFVIPSLANTNKLDGLSTRNYATYNCPDEKHDVLKSEPQTDIVWASDLLKVIANANLIGN